MRVQGYMRTSPIVMLSTGRVSPLFFSHFSLEKCFQLNNEKGTKKSKTQIGIIRF
jgi:hypothetical protein